MLLYCVYTIPEEEQVQIDNHCVKKDVAFQASV